MGLIKYVFFFINPVIPFDILTFDTDEIILLNIYIVVFLFCVFRGFLLFMSMLKSKRIM